MTNPRPNPYPGPRPFKRGETLYGRERETAELLDLLIAERIVLLSSPSGAGKTSLVQAALDARAGTGGLPRPAGDAPRPPARRACSRRQPLRPQAAAWIWSKGCYEDETEERQASPAELGGDVPGRLPGPSPCAAAPTTEALAQGTAMC